jgi:hypothetical protein
LSKPELSEQVAKVSPESSGALFELQNSPLAWVLHEATIKPWEKNAELSKKAGTY